MDLSSRRTQLYWGKDFPPDLNIDNHPDLPPSKGIANFYDDRRKRNHNHNHNQNQNKRLESAEKAWLHTLPWSYAEVVINKPRRFKENNQDNVEFKNICFSDMILKSANESNGQTNIMKPNPESSEGDSFLNPNANEFVPEIQSNGNKDTSCQLYEDKEISPAGKDIVNDDDVTSQEQFIISESNDSYNDEEISVMTKSNDETTVQDDNETASQTNTIYEVPELDKQNTEINPSDACEEENNVIEAEEENGTATHNQLMAAESINNECDVSEINQSYDNEEQDDQSSHKSQVEQTHIETSPDFESSSRNFKENEELADEREEVNLESKCISPDQVESEYQSHDSQAQVESEILELDNANKAQIESEIPTAINDTEKQLGSDDLGSNNVYRTQTESGIPESNTVKEAQPATKIEEGYNDCESLAESEFSETIIASEAQVDSEIQESYNDSQLQVESEILDSNINREAQVESEIQEPYNATQSQEESESQESYNITQLQEESEIQESYNATQFQGESEILDASIGSEAQVESEIHESYNPTQFQEEPEIQEAYNAPQLQGESEIQESYDAPQLQEESEIQESYNARQLQEESEIQESCSPTQLQEESEVNESYNPTQLQEELENKESCSPTQLQEESEIQEQFNATALQADSDIQDSNVVSRTQDESEQSELSKLSHDRSDETEIFKSSDSNDHDITEIRNLSSEKKSYDKTNLDEIKSVQDNLVNNKITNDEVKTTSHQDVDKENSVIAPDPTTTKKNKKRKNKRKNKANNQLSNGLNFDELVKDKTNYAENHFDKDESTIDSVSINSSRTTSHQLAQTKHSPNQSYREHETKLTSKSSEIKEENTNNNGETKDLNDSKSIKESIQNNTVDDENNVIKFKDEHFDMNEVDKFIEEEQKAMAEFPNELDVENQIKLEEELKELSKQNEELKENISNENKEETNNQNDNVMCEKEDSALAKDDAASLAGSSDQESSFEIINENAVRDDVVDVNKLSQDLLNDDGDLDENEINNKSNKILSSTDTISSDISSIPQEDNIENQTYDISVAKELDINKNETVMNIDAVEQNDQAHNPGIDIQTENNDVLIQEDHFSNKPTETIAEKLSSETFDAAKTNDIIDDREMAENIETGFNNVESNEINKEIANSEVLNKDLVTDESINNENIEASFITERPLVSSHGAERPLVSSHGAVNDEKIVAFVTQIEKPNTVMNGGELVSELPDQLEIKGLASDLINNEVLLTKIPDIVITKEMQDEPLTKEDNITAESCIVEELVKSNICSGLEKGKINQIAELPTELIETKNKEIAVINERSKTDEKSDLVTSDTELESKQIEDFTISDETGDEKMLKEMINKLPNRIIPTNITENDVESAAIQELSTIAEITERTVSELPEDNTGQIVHAESDVEKSEKNVETIQSQEEEGVSNDSGKSFRTETESTISSQQDDEGLLPKTSTEAGKGCPAKNKMTVSAFIKPKTIDIKTSSKSSPKTTSKTSSKPTTTTTSKPAATKLPPTSAAKPAAGTAKLAAIGTTKTAKPSAATAKLATTGTAKPVTGTVKSSATGSTKPVPGSPKLATAKTAVGAAVKVGSKTASPTKPTVTTIKIAIKAAPKVASTKPTTPPGKTVAAIKPTTPPLKISLTTKPSTPPSKPSTPKPPKTPPRPSTATKPLTPTSKANLAAAISLPAKPDSSTTSGTSTSTTMKKPSTPTSKSVEKSSSKTSTTSSKPSSATRPSSASSKTPQPIRKPTTSSKPAAAVLKAASDTLTKTVVKNITEPSKTIVRNLSDQSKSTLKTSSTSSSTKQSTTDKTKTTSSPKTSSKSSSTIKKSTTTVKDKKAKPSTKTDDKNVKKSIKTSSNKIQQINEMNGTLNEVSSTTDYISSDGLSQLSELPPQIIV